MDAAVKLTAFERKVLEALRRTLELPVGRWPQSRDVARWVWPDSPGWTRAVGGWNGFPGKTMPASMGARLHKMAAKGLVQQSSTSGHLATWAISTLGYKLLTDPT